MQSFFEFLKDFDHSFLLAVNSWHSEFLDMVMLTYSHRFVWIPLYILFAWLLLKKYGWRKMILISVMIALTITVTDQFCGSILRPIFCRPRPGYSEIGGLLHFVNDYRGGHYGFPSCHAANSGALVGFLICMFGSRKFALALLIWAIVMGYSRLYLGVHYPSDLITGYCIGGAIGTGFGILTLKLLSRRVFVPWFEAR